MNKLNYGKPEDRVIWSTVEDQALLHTVALYGNKKWKIIHRHIIAHTAHFTKSSKQCRERWYNYLNPTIKKTAWTEQELDIVFQAHLKYGNKWSVIGRELDGRTDNAIKNIIYCRMRKQIRRIAKYSVDQEIYSSNRNFERALYILSNLKEQYFTPLEKSSPLSGDQYIIRIIQKHAMSSDTLIQYSSHVLSLAPVRMKSMATVKYPSLFEQSKDDSMTISSFHSTEAILPKFNEQPINSLKAQPITNYEKSLFMFDCYMKKKLYIPIVIQ